MCRHNNLANLPTWSVLGQNSVKIGHFKKNQSIQKKMLTTQLFKLCFISLKYLWNHYEVNHNIRILKINSGLNRAT